MFNKAKDNTPEAATATPAAAPAPVQQPQQPKRSAPVRSAPSIISSDLVVTGTLSSTGDMQVDGRVEGDVHSAALVIGEKAVIQGEVLADEVTVRGRVEGSIRARKILLCSTSMSKATSCMRPLPSRQALSSRVTAATPTTRLEKTMPSAIRPLSAERPPPPVHLPYRPMVVQRLRRRASRLGRRVRPGLRQ